MAFFWQCLVGQQAKLEFRRENIIDEVFLEKCIKLHIDPYPRYYLVVYTIFSFKERRSLNMLCSYTIAQK